MRALNNATARRISGLMWLIATLIHASDASPLPGEHLPRQPPTVEALAAPLVAVSPTFCRVELATGGTTIISLEVVAAEPTQLLSVEADCGCLRAVLPVDRKLPVGRTTLRVNVIGVLPGVKTLSVRTSAGTVSAIVQVVTPGLGDGAAVAAHLRAQAANAGHHLIVIVHDLLGETRNCGCSGGSLGGIDHLAALREVLPGARLVLTGRCENGAIPLIGPLLMSYGWELSPADIVVTSEPLTALERPGLLALVNTSLLAVANQRVVQPILYRGAIAVVLEVTPQGMVVAQHLLPIDQSLPSVAALTHVDSASVVTVDIDATATPSTACASCHLTAHATWSGSAHARAFASLLPADQKNGCAICHSTSLTGTVTRAPNVGCTACHTGADAHTMTPTTRTTGTTDCRTCHDAQHHPAFDRETALEKILHGK